MLQITCTLALDDRDARGALRARVGAGRPERQQGGDRGRAALQRRRFVAATRGQGAAGAIAGRARMTADGRAADRQPRAPDTGAEPRGRTRAAGRAHPSGDYGAGAATGDEDHEGSEAAPADQEEARRGQGRAWPSVRRRLIALGSLPSLLRGLPRRALLQHQRVGHVVIVDVADVLTVSRPIRSTRCARRCRTRRSDRVPAASVSRRSCRIRPGPAL